MLTLFFLCVTVLPFTLSQPLSNFTTSSWILPLPIESPACGYDELTNKIYVYGGKTSNGISNSVFSFNFDGVSLYPNFTTNIGSPIWYFAHAYITGPNFYFYANMSFGQFNPIDQSITYPLLWNNNIIPILTGQWSWNYNHASLAITNDNNYLIVLGGDGLNAMQIYDIYNQTWLTGSNMIEQRAFFTCTVASNNILYAIGGYTVTIEFVDISDINNIAAWSYMSAGNELLKNTQDLRSISFGDYIYIVGGLETPPDRASYSVYAIDITNQKLIQLDDLPIAVASMCMVISNNRIWILAGELDQYSTASDFIMYSNLLLITETPTVQPTDTPITNIPTTSTPTKIPTTSIPTVLPTRMPTTSTPTTSIPTKIPTTNAPITSMPTTMPITSVPSTLIPTKNPNTFIPTSMPTTFRPTTSTPTTFNPTVNPITLQPITTNPTTQQPTFINPTSNPITLQPISRNPTTLQPVSSNMTTLPPTNLNPTSNPITTSLVTFEPTSNPTDDGQVNDISTTLYGEVTNGHGDSKKDNLLDNDLIMLVIIIVCSAILLNCCLFIGYITFRKKNRNKNKDKATQMERITSSSSNINTTNINRVSDSDRNTIGMSTHDGFVNDHATPQYPDNNVNDNNDDNDDNDEDLLNDDNDELDDMYLDTNKVTDDGEQIHGNTKGGDDDISNNADNHNSDDEDIYYKLHQEPTKR